MGKDLLHIPQHPEIQRTTVSVDYWATQMLTTARMPPVDRQVVTYFIFSGIHPILNIQWKVWRTTASRLRPMLEGLRSYLILRRRKQFRPHQST